jgi:cyclopropane-fatty-acyl-phospholipid synthase
MTTPAPINAWMEKYIFPGSYLPSLSQLAPLLEQRGLWLTDFEMLRLHYAKTLAAWDERFQARRNDIAAMFDERFCRMWEFYLQLCEAAFRHRTLVVFQMQMAKRIDALPITRDYVYADGAGETRQTSPAGNNNKATTKRRSRTAAKAASGSSSRRSSKRNPNRTTRSR